VNQKTTNKLKVIVHNQPTEEEAKMKIIELSKLLSTMKFSK